MLQRFVTCTTEIEIPHIILCQVVASVDARFGYCFIFITGNLTVGVYFIEFNSKMLLIALVGEY